MAYCSFSTLQGIITVVKICIHLYKKKNIKKSKYFSQSIQFELQIIKKCALQCVVMLRDYLCTWCLWETIGHIFYTKIYIIPFLQLRHKVILVSDGIRHVYSCFSLHDNMAFYLLICKRSGQRSVVRICRCPAVDELTREVLGGLHLVTVSDWHKKQWDILKKDI